MRSSVGGLHGPREARVRERLSRLHGLDRLKRQPQIDNVRIVAQPPRRRPSAPLQNQADIAPQRVPRLMSLLTFLLTAPLYNKATIALKKALRFDVTVNIFVDE